jgi:hypothetical protein
MHLFEPGDYTTPTLAERLERSLVGVRLLVRCGDIPKPDGTRAGKGSPYFWKRSKIERAITKNPGLVLPAKGGAQ